MAPAGSHLRGKYAIVGVGQSKLGQVPGVGPTELLAQAMKAAIEDAGLSKNDVDGIISRGPDDVYCHHQEMGQILGIDANFSTSMDNGGASQILSVILATMAIDAGLCHTAVCGYGRDGFSRTHRSEKSKVEMNLIPADQLPVQFGPEYGYFGAVAAHAFGATRHMHLYGTTREQLGAVAVTFRKHACKNPLAQMQKPLTIEDYLKARLIVYPFGLYDCSLTTDGAGAVVVTSAERARGLKQPPVYIQGFGTFNNLRGWFFDDHMVYTAAKKSAEKAYAMAGVGPKDIHSVQVYDCFTYMVAAQLEDYGFCAKGEGGPFVASGALDIDGSLPTNTSGGQLSEGHVEGMLQIVEAVHQLRRDRPEGRQVKNAEVGLVTGHGGNTVCHSTLILSR